MKLISSRFRLIILCALFNLLFEYSARGISQFISRPIFMLALFGIYLSYFAMLEDLIVRFKLRNYQIFIVAFLYGLIPTAFLTGNLFNKSIYSGFIFAGINLGTLFIIGILAWGVMQGMITLYLANRIFPRDWNHPKMGKLGWSLAILYQTFIMIIASRNPVTPRGTLVGFLFLGLLIVISALLFLVSIKVTKQQEWPFCTSKVMDFLAFGSVLLFLIFGTFLISGPVVITSQPLNRLAVSLENIWVFLCGIVFFIYRFGKGSDVTV